MRLLRQPDPQHRPIRFALWCFLAGLFIMAFGIPIVVWEDFFRPAWIRRKARKAAAERLPLMRIVA